MSLILEDVGYSDDLIIQDGDFVIQPSDRMHVEHILRTYLGCWKEYPLLGVGVDFFRGSSGQSQKLKTDIVGQLTDDGYSVTKVNVQVVDGNPKIEVEYDRIRNGRI